MQQSATMNKLGPLWTIALFFWNIRKVVSIILLVLTLVYLFFNETLEQRRFMLTEFSETQKTITKHEIALKIIGDTVFSGPSRDGRSITTEHATQLYVGVQSLRSQLSALSPPNDDIEKTKDHYVRSLANLQGRINLFDEGEEGTNDVLEAMVGIEVPATNYGIAVKKYQNSVWRSFWAAF